MEGEYASRFWRCCDGPQAVSLASGPAPCSLIQATSAFPAIASTIALATFTALFFVEARLPQLPTIGHASARLGAISTAVALSHLAAFPPYPCRRDVSVRNNRRPILNLLDLLCVAAVPSPPARGIARAAVPAPERRGGVTIVKAIIVRMFLHSQ